MQNKAFIEALEQTLSNAESFRDLAFILKVFFVSCLAQSMPNSNPDMTELGAESTKNASNCLLGTTKRQNGQHESCLARSMPGPLRHD
jgi:hypothetical protein